MKAVVQNVNIRGCEARKNKADEGYLLVRFEDEFGKPNELVDKDMDREKYYKRNTDMDLTIDIIITGKYTNIRIIDATEVK